jgi:serine/threonine protein kinase
MHARGPTNESNLTVKKKKLDHPNIIKFIDSVILNNELYIICEWAEKGDLKR